MYLYIYTHTLGASAALRSQTQRILSQILSTRATDVLDLSMNLGPTSTDIEYYMGSVMHNRQDMIRFPQIETITASLLPPNSSSRFCIAIAQSISALPMLTNPNKE